MHMAQDNSIPKGSRKTNGQTDRVCATRKTATCKALLHWQWRYSDWRNSRFVRHAFQYNCWFHRPQHVSHEHNCTVKWKEPNWPQKPNWPQFLEGQFGPSRFVLDYLSQNGQDTFFFLGAKSTLLILQCGSNQILSKLSFTSTVFFISPNFRREIETLTKSLKWTPNS